MDGLQNKVKATQMLFVEPNSFAETTLFAKSYVGITTDGKPIENPLRYFQFPNSLQANQAIKPIDKAKLFSSISNVSVCKPEVMPFARLPVPKR